MKKIIAGLLLSTLATNYAFAICEHERGERDEFRNLCIGFGGASVGIAYGGHALIPIIGGLFGLIPGAIAQNQCRIWQEKENNLAGCERNHYEGQKQNLQNQKNALEEIQRKNARINQINADYDAKDNQAKEDHKTAIRVLMQSFMENGRNMRDPNVQAELKTEVKRMEGDLNTKLQQLADDRKREIDAVG